MLYRIFLILVFVAGGAIVVDAQTRVQQPIQTDKPDEHNPFSSSPLDDMRARMAIRYAEKEHRENLNRANELARISSELKTSFVANSVVGKEDRKRVERIEKLAKNIRNEAGGSEGDLDPINPANLGDAIEQIAKTADELNKSVSATPRLVVSATVIEQANQLIQLVRYVRGNNR